MRLVQGLVQLGVLTEKQCEDVLTESERTGTPPISIVLALKLMSVEQLQDALQRLAELEHTKMTVHQYVDDAVKIASATQDLMCRVSGKGYSDEM